MTGTELRQIREEIRYDLRSMARALDMPYRTYQDYEYGRRGIPREAAEAIQALRRRNAKWMATWRRRLTADINRTYPKGIPSVPAGGEEE